MLWTQSRSYNAACGPAYIARLLRHKYLLILLKVHILFKSVTGYRNIKHIQVISDEMFAVCRLSSFYFAVQFVDLSCQTNIQTLKSFFLVANYITPYICTAVCLVLMLTWDDFCHHSFIKHENLNFTNAFVSLKRLHFICLKKRKRFKKFQFSLSFLIFIFCVSL